MMSAEEPPAFHWDGPLPAPDFVMIPKLVHREILKHLSGAEFKVFYCLLVKAYEWGNGNAELSLGQIIDLGGVGRGSVQRAVLTLQEMGLLEVIHHRSDRHGDEANTYRVLVTDDPRYIDRHPMPKMGMAPPQNDHGQGNNGDGPAQGGDGSRARSLPERRSKKEESDHSKNIDTLHIVQDEEGYLERVIRDLSVEFHDPEHAASNITQARNLMAKSGLDEAQFVALCQQVRKTVKARGNIEKLASDGSPSGVRNRMPYFYATLLDRLDG